jgi:hypothetical protein
LFTLTKKPNNAIDGGIPEKQIQNDANCNIIRFKAWQVKIVNIGKNVTNEGQLGEKPCAIAHLKHVLHWFFCNLTNQVQFCNGGWAFT